MKPNPPKGSSLGLPLHMNPGITSQSKGVGPVGPVSGVIHSRNQPATNSPPMIQGMPPAMYKPPESNPLGLPGSGNLNGYILK